MPSGSRPAGRRAARAPSGGPPARRASGVSIPEPAEYAGGTASGHPGESRRVGAVHSVTLRQRLKVAGGGDHGGGGCRPNRGAGGTGGGAPGNRAGVGGVLPARAG